MISQFSKHSNSYLVLDLLSRKPEELYEVDGYLLFALETGNLRRAVISQEHVKVERTDSVKSRYNLHRCTHTHTSFVYTLFFLLKKFIGFLKLDLSEEFL